VKDEQRKTVRFLKFHRQGGNLPLRLQWFFNMQHFVWIGALVLLEELMQVGTERGG
jgi:hypothetical protein